MHADHHDMTEQTKRPEVPMMNTVNIQGSLGSIYGELLLPEAAFLLAH